MVEIFVDMFLFENLLRIKRMFFSAFPWYQMLLGFTDYTQMGCER